MPTPDGSPPATDAHPTRPGRWKRWAWRTLQIAVPALILSWLVLDIDPPTRQRLLEPRDGRLLVLAFLVVLLSVAITHVRWFLLVRALGLPFRVREALQLGFLCYLLNFVSVGAVGGDLYKAFFIARRQPGRRAEAVATVVVDRMFGLYALLLVTSVAILLSDVGRATPAVQWIANLTLLLTAVGALAILVVLVPGFTSGSLSEALTRLPRVGPTIGSLIGAVRMYRRRPAVLTATGLLSLLVHTLLALAIYWIAAAMFWPVPSLVEHLVIVPLSMVVGALPISPAGLGTTELAMTQLYQLVPVDPATMISGASVALVYRAVTIGIAAVGMIFYWTSRREVRQVFQQASAGEPAAAERPAPP